MLLMQPRRSCSIRQFRDGHDATRREPDWRRRLSELLSKHLSGLVACCCRCLKWNCCCRARFPITPIFSRPSNTLRTVGRLFRPGKPLAPNYKWGADRVSRPGVVHRGKRHYCAAAQWADRCERRRFTDFFSNTDAGLRAGVGRILGPRHHGATIPIAKAEDHLFGVCLLNDCRRGYQSGNKYIPSLKQ